MSKIRTKSESISPLTAEMLSIVDATNLANILQKILNIGKNNTHFYNHRTIAILKVINASIHGILNVQAHLAPSLSKIIANFGNPDTHRHHIDTSLNIADIDTRPISVSDLEQFTKWFTRPPLFLETDIPTFEEPTYLKKR